MKIHLFWGCRISFYWIGKCTVVLSLFVIIHIHSFVSNFNWICQIIHFPFHDACIPFWSCNGMTWEHWSSFSYFVQKYNVRISLLCHVVFIFMAHDKTFQKVHQFESYTSSSLTIWKHQHFVLLILLPFFTHLAQLIWWQINTFKITSLFIFHFLQDKMTTIQRHYPF